MKKLLMNEKEYIEKVIKKAKSSKKEKVYSYDFQRVINLLVKKEVKHESLSQEEIDEIIKKAEHNFNHFMNYPKGDKDKEFPKRSLEEIYNKKLLEYIKDKYKDTYCKQIKDIMKEISYTFNELQWEKFIVSNVKNQILYNKKLKEIDKIYFSKTDLEILNKEYINKETGNILILNDTEKRLMFTYMIIAKYYNQDDPTSSNINISVNDMFKFANMGSMKKNFKIEMLNKLQDMELIKLNFYFKGKKRDISYKVLQCDISNENNENIFFVSGKGNEENLLMDIGKKYKDMVKMFNNEKLKQCGICGMLIEKTNNRAKYCKNCYEYLNRENAMNRYINNR